MELQKLTIQLRPNVDKDQNNKIAWLDFESYASYLTNESEKLRSALETKRKKESEFQKLQLELETKRKNEEVNIGSLEFS